ncbi:MULTISPECIES: GNAT family N-acetyltransferase [unclassified Bosea (in: a-proteobacteria)]|uniref:GNAT family N-acetyltransferase n=1 Tax=unclassified Bosea (in: a-proteobacteria) TaxID=2653178 RepID=UPI000F7EA231|nr:MULTISPECIES: GNAT family N-acetyltransferase [unclassified Bosea (in: a-proteobacteria)]RXT27744.1 GNAT family N-acetyltransferase [Bosea sp. Tri-39]RXT36073.1 GNAT family N-acetyltransferase [Bosea sp. Tri-54]
MISTKRLQLRPSVAADAQRAFEIQSDWAVTRMLRMASFPPDRTETEAWFADHPRQWRDGEAYRFAAMLDGRMIGLVDIDEIAGSEGELGYWFERVAWGHGFASESARAVVRFAFAEAGLSALRSGHAADNVASGRILARLGFRLLDQVERSSRSRGETVLQCRYRLMRDEFVERDRLFDKTDA